MKKMLVKLFAAVCVFGICYAASVNQIPQSPWINNKVKYFMTHNSDFQAIAQNTWQNAKFLLDTAIGKVNHD